MLIKRDVRPDCHFSVYTELYGAIIVEELFTNPQTDLQMCAEIIQSVKRFANLCKDPLMHAQICK